MKRLLLLFLILSHTSPAVSQDTVFTLSGHITDCRTRERVKGVTLKLFCSDGRTIEKPADSSGNYHFDGSIMKRNLHYVLVVLGHSDPVAVKNCYLGSSEKFKFSTFDSCYQKRIVKHFCLAKNEHCEFILPTLHFEKNSYTSFSIDPEEYDLDLLKGIMLDNPTFVFQIIANSSTDEKDPLVLSQKRGAYIQDLLINKGIAKERMVVQADGLKKASISIPEIDQLKTIAEKEAAHKKNRRVVFTVLRKKP